MPPALQPGEHEHVRIYHDECAIHANDFKQEYCLKGGEQLLKKKERGHVMMVSYFITPTTPTCHLELNNEQIMLQKMLPESERVLEKAQWVIYPLSKAGCDDWWNMEQMIDQVSNCISWDYLFSCLYRLEIQ